MVQHAAVVVRNATKRYGKEVVLDGLNMTVVRGSIYGLLGASGCGKTTLLSCIVGIRYLDSGEMWALGGTPGSKSSGIPGPRVGYMPQDISLVGEFSMSGAFYYFGRINGLDDDEIETRQTFFSELLQLPPADHLVKNMSGGQQRRASFAVTLIHRPELLILDEPTVGLDPILRKIIWDYLIKLTQEEGITVLITTHYIEETKSANTISLLRRGKLLTESAPQDLLEQFQYSYLEEVFLKLCETQEDTITLNERHQGPKESTSSDILYEDQDEYKQTKAVSERRVSLRRKFKALLMKNGVKFLSCDNVLLFSMLVPILQISAFILGIGGDPRGIKIGVVNDEAGNCDFGCNFGNIWNDKMTCHFGNLSCRFLHNFDKSIVTQEYYDSFSEATHAVQNGKLTGIIHFSQNFSKGLQMRIEDGIYAKDSDLYASHIQVFLDMSDRQIGLITQKKLFDRFLEIYETIMQDCKYPTKLAHPPIQFENPIYGTAELHFRDSMTPPFMIIISFILALTVSTTLIIGDRLEGVWDRSIVQGVRTEEILLSHILIQNAFTVTHTTIIMFFIFVIPNMECKGSIFAVTFLLGLNGFCGLMYGFVISVMCKNQYLATYISIGSFLVLGMLNGFLWPIEGMPKLLRWFSYALPATLPSVSMKGLIIKGYSIFDSEVYIGFLISLGWTLLFCIMTMLGVRIKS